MEGSQSNYIIPECQHAGVASLTEEVAGLWDQSMGHAIGEADPIKDVCIRNRVEEEPCGLSGVWVQHHSQRTDQE